MKRTVIVLVVFVVVVLLSVWLLGCQTVEGAGHDIVWMSQKVQEGDRQ